MAKSDASVVGIAVIRPVSGEGGGQGKERRTARLAPKKTESDRVDISSRARRLADIEDLLAKDDNDRSKSKE